MQVLILNLAPHLCVGYSNQVVWRIPEELMKGVSQSRFPATMLLGHDFVNRGFSRSERRSVIEVG
jgi:hypothetical protein